MRIKKRLFLKLSTLVLVLLMSTMKSPKAAGMSTQNALEKKITVELKDVLLKDALERIGDLADISFVYVNNEALDINKVTVHAHDEKVGALLDKLLTPYSLSYAVVYDRIVIRRNEKKPARAASMIIKTEVAPLQQRIIDVKGVVTSQKKEPLMGISIGIKGTTRATVTNERGEFEVTRANPDALLGFSGTGF